jgi:poly [ADP-ribose] polymerase
MRNQAFTGDAPVDAYVPNADKYEVVTLFNKVYSCTLNQSNVNHNNNKFYILQILKDKAAEKYFTFFRWGRVGKSGMTNFQSFGADYPSAMAEYEEKMEAKTVKGKYTILEIVYDDEISPEEQDRKMVEDMKSCKLNPRVSELIKLIFDVKIV